MLGWNEGVGDGDLRGGIVIMMLVFYMLGGKNGIGGWKRMVM